MSFHNVQTIIGKATVDRAYRDLLFSQPDAALKGFELSAEETASLKALSREKFDAVAGELEEQILAGAVGGTGLKLTENEQLLPAVRQFDLTRFGMYANTN